MSPLRTGNGDTILKNTNSGSPGSSSTQLLSPHLNYPVPVEELASPTSAGGAASFDTALFVGGSVAPPEIQASSSSNNAQMLANDD